MRVVFLARASGAPYASVMALVAYDDDPGAQERFAISYRAAQAWSDTVRELRVMRAWLELARQGLTTALACPEEGQEALSEERWRLMRQIEQPAQQIDAASPQQQLHARLARDEQRELSVLVDTTLAA
jgi:hypothetical protein